MRIVPKRKAAKKTRFAFWPKMMGDGSYIIFERYYPLERRPVKSRGTDTISLHPKDEPHED